jgi:hypothetical protein
VIGMKNSATVLSARSEFDAFLFAHIGEEKNGMLLSVLSALARLDLDPWREAAELARMPQQTARERLTFLIEALPNQPPTRPEPETVSTRLIALLPPAASPSVASSNKLPRGVSTLNYRAVLYVILVNLVLMFGAEWAASTAQPPIKVAGAQASSVSAVRPVEVSAATKPMIINQVVKKERPMADQQTPPNADDSPDQTKPDPVGQRQQEQQQPQSALLAQQDRRPVPGRRPLFRSN